MTLGQLKRRQFKILKFAKNKIIQNMKLAQRDQFKRVPQTF